MIDLSKPLPRWVKWIDNKSAEIIESFMCPPYEFENGKIFNTCKDNIPFLSLADTWKEFLGKYPFNFEACLPEKWGIKRTSETDIIITDYIYDQYKVNHVYLDYNPDNPYLHNISDIISSNDKLYQGYEEITFEEFETYCLGISKPKSTVMLGFKGFDKDLKCRGTQFEIGITYTKPNETGNAPELCTADGYHYCTDMDEVFEYYSSKNRNNRFCIIEILGESNGDGKKYSTYSFRIIKELTHDQLRNAQSILNEELIDYEAKKELRDQNEVKLKSQLNLEELIQNRVNKILAEQSEKVKNDKDKRKQKIAVRMKLDIVRKFQELYPHTQIGGSVALFLHGIELKRFENENVNDFDIITPYYTKFKEDVPNLLSNDEQTTYTSGCDFDEHIMFNGVKCDIRIDNHQKYDLITYEGFEYKVSVLEAIWAAKLRYNKPKHINDLKEAMSIK